MKHLKKINEKFSDSNFIAVLKQSGEGCDYTIGCGLSVINLESEKFDDAYDELVTLIKEEYNGDISLSSATLYKIASSDTMNLKEIYSEKEAQLNSERELRNENSEREEYERLHKKFAK